MRKRSKNICILVLMSVVLTSCQGFDPQVPEPAILLNGDYRALSECAYTNALRSGGWRMTTIESQSLVEMTLYSENLITARLEVTPNGEGKAKLVGFYMSSLLGRQTGIDRTAAAFAECARTQSLKTSSAPEKQ